MLQAVLSWFSAATPVWLSLCMIAAGGVLGWLLRALVKRVDRHARSISHMDDWADAVDHRLEQLDSRSRRPISPTPAASRPPVDPAGWRRS